MAQSSMPDMLELWSSSHFNGASAAWLEELYEAYLTDRDSVGSQWQDVFDALLQKNNGSSAMSIQADIPHSEVRNYFKALV